MASYCPFCMSEADGNFCNQCGKPQNYEANPQQLPAGIVLNGVAPYLFGAALGQGGYGVTYIAMNCANGQKVAIKEYFPTAYSYRDGNNIFPLGDTVEGYEKGRASFLEEARTLATLNHLPSIVHVLDYFEANNTAYLVMEYVEGEPLFRLVRRKGRLQENEMLNKLRPLMEDISKMHRTGIIHRDIAPDNIMVTPEGTMRLIDFGSARSVYRQRTMTVAIKQGFAPPEQYLSKGQGAFTDVYSLGATLYYCLSGQQPPDSQALLQGVAELEPLSTFGVSPALEASIMKAMTPVPRNRIQTMDGFLLELFPIQNPNSQPIVDQIPQTNAAQSVSQPDEKVELGFSMNIENGRMLVIIAKGKTYRFELVVVATVLGVFFLFFIILIILIVS